jgi:alcohol dehydrogenase
MRPTIKTRLEQPRPAGADLAGDRGTMRAVEVTSERQLRLTDVPRPADPAPDEVQIKVRSVALNHIDVWGWRGMAFARRTLPIIAGAEAAGEVIKAGCDVTDLRPGDIVSIYGARTCGTCPACREGRDNFCETLEGMYGFHIDGFLCEYANVPARIAVKAPPGLDAVGAGLAPITFGTVEHMFFDNAKLRAGETVLVHAGGSGIGSAAIQLAKAAGAVVITTVGSEEKAVKARALGADHVINYTKERFESRVRKLTGRRGVDVVFEHVGPQTWPGSLLSMARGARLVTCGSTTGIMAETNLNLLFQQQLKLLGSFGCTRRNMADAMAKLAAGVVKPVIDTTISLEEIDTGLKRLESRQVFGKIVVAI